MVDPPSSGAGESALFSRVVVDRASQVIVEQVKELIAEGRLLPGDRLPSERDLCRQFGVSRVTVREALRVLEAGGLVRIRVGAQGGAFLTTPSAEQIGEGLALFMSLSPLTAGAVTEARMIFELGILPLVMERVTAADVADLRALVAQAEEALGEGRYTMEMSAAYHVRVAACAHNPAIEMLVRSFYGPLLMSLREAQVAEPLMGHLGTREHAEVVDAIELRDIAAAREVMRAHLTRTAERIASLENEAGAGEENATESPAKR